jgi:hypothetical protein
MEIMGRLAKEDQSYLWHPDVHIGTKVLCIKDSSVTGYYDVGKVYEIKVYEPTGEFVLGDSTLNGYNGEFEFYEEEVTTPTVTRYTEEPNMAQFPYMLSNESATVFFEGRVLQVLNTDSRFEPLVEHLKLPTHDRDVLEGLLDKPKQIARLTEGLVEVREDTVFYKNEAVNDTLAQKLVSLIDGGFDARPWARFMSNLMENPSYRSREQLYQFLEKHGAPITPDGHFIAFKNVRSDFKDIHSGTFDNSPGKIVAMPRQAVDDDQNRTCSAGLHACASPYLDHFYRSGSRTVAVKINPRDVVSIPTDYDFAKMRVSQYEVLSEVDRGQVKEIEQQVIYGTVDPVDDYEDVLYQAGHYDDEYDSYDSYDSYDYN